jgi:photosystem II stability/assembly factor-like uncharacterized protein
MGAVATKQHRSTRGARNAIIVGCVASALLAFAGPSRQSAAASPRPEPQFLVRAGTTRDLYALLESSAFTHANVIERSTDGGATFQRMGSLPITNAAARFEPVISQLVFPTANVGIAVGYTVKTQRGSVTPLYVTRDGGQTWSKEEISPSTEIQKIATTSKYLYAIAANCPNTSQCAAWRLDRATLSALHWSSFPLPEIIAKYQHGLGFTAFGNDVWLNTMDQVSKPFPSYLATSQNLGTTFTISVQPDLQSVNSCELQAVSREMLWATCDDGNMMGQIPYSDDGGAHWILRDYSTSILSSFAFGSFDPVSSSLAFAVDGNFPNRLYSVTGGSTAPRVVSSVLKKRFPLTVCFVNARDGVVLAQGGGGSNATVWFTRDRGAHWQRVLQ